MHYAYPQLIGLGVAVAGTVVGLATLAWLRRRRALRLLAQTPAAPQLFLVNSSLRAFKTCLLVVAGGLVAFSVLGPQWGEVEAEPPEAPSSGRDVLLLLDVSRSMLAEDVPPDRLRRARADIRDLVTSLERQGGYRVGLIAFADRAAVLCPLTSDFRCFEEELARASLEGLRLRGDTGDEGTQIGAALARAAAVVDPQAAPYTDVILISDGGDMEQDTLAAADVLAKAGVPVHALGVGSPAQGALIPVTRADGTRGHLQYKGELVRTKLEEEVLRQIAKRTGGQYVAVGTGFLELDRWYANLARSKAARELSSAGTSRQFVHRFQWFLAPALGLLLLHAVLGEARRATSAAPEKGRYFVWLRRRRFVETTAPTRNETGERS